MKYIFCAFWLIVMAIGITFSGLNSRLVLVNYYLDEKQIQLPMLLLITLAIGVVLGFITLLPAFIRKKHANHRLKHRIKQIEQEVDNLRTMPIKETH